MARQFNDVIADLGGGLTHEALTDRLGEVVLAVQETQRAGSLTLTLKVTPNGERSIFIIDEIKTKVPEPKRANALFFTDQAGNLHRRDPRQPDLPLREVRDERA